MDECVARVRLDLSSAVLAIRRPRRWAKEREAAAGGADWGPRLQSLRAALLLRDAGLTALSPVLPKGLEAAVAAVRARGRVLHRPGRAKSALAHRIPHPAPGPR